VMIATPRIIVQEEEEERLPVEADGKPPVGHTDCREYAHHPHDRQVGRA